MKKDLQYKREDIIDGMVYEASRVVQLLGYQNIQGVYKLYKRTKRDYKQKRMGKMCFTTEFIRKYLDYKECLVDKA